MPQHAARFGEYWDREEEYMLIRRTVRAEPLDRIAHNHARTAHAIVLRIEAIFGVDSDHAGYYRQELDKLNRRR